MKGVKMIEICNRKRGQGGNTHKNKGWGKSSRCCPTVWNIGKDYLLLAPGKSGRNSEPPGIQ